MADQQAKHPSRPCTKSLKTGEAFVQAKGIDKNMVDMVVRILWSSGRWSAESPRSDRVFAEELLRSVQRKLFAPLEEVPNLTEANAPEVGEILFSVPPPHKIRDFWFDPHGGRVWVLCDCSTRHIGRAGQEVDQAEVPPGRLFWLAFYILRMEFRSIVAQAIACLRKKIRHKFS